MRKQESIEERKWYHSIFVFLSWHELSKAVRTVQLSEKSWVSPLANFFFQFFRLIILVAFRFSRKSERSTRTVSMETVISSVFFLFSEADKSKTSMTRAPHCIYLLLAGWKVQSRAALSNPRPQLSTKRTDSKPSKRFSGRMKQANH